MNTIKLGSNGADVKIWQHVLNLTEDGSFGPVTDAATKQWQSQHGLTPDGIVGPHTWAVAGFASSNAMRASARAAFLPVTEPLEGKVMWMYLDVLGLVTVAIGNLIDGSRGNPDPAVAMIPALSLPFVRVTGGNTTTPATREEIAAEWRTIKAHQELVHLGYVAAKAFAKLRLTDAGVDQVVNAKLDQMLSYLHTRFPDFDSWPADAQLATVSMSWACGPAFHFDTLEAALKAKDFTTAANACLIHPNEGSIVRRNAMNKQMYLNAAESAALGRDFDTLVYKVAA